MAAVPSLLLLEKDALFCWWFQVASCFSMFPLLVRDGLRIPYWCCLILFSLVFAIHKYVFETVKEADPRSPKTSLSRKFSWRSLTSLFNVVVLLSIIGKEICSSVFSVEILNVIISITCRDVDVTLYGSMYYTSFSIPRLVSCTVCLVFYVYVQLCLFVFIHQVVARL